MVKIVRIKKIDLKGDKSVGNVIQRIKGIGFMMSNAITNSLNINKKTHLEDLTDEELEKLKEAIEDPSKLNIPKWMLNRQRDTFDGETRHLTGMDIALTVREDIKLMQESRSRKGFRHAVGLKVRGQKTKAHPRKGKTVGVLTKKKAAKMQKKGGEAAPKEAAPKGGKK